MNGAQEPTYLSYLIRLWRSDASTPWRASLHSTATGEIHHFADVERMWTYLNAQMAGERDAPPEAPETGTSE